MSALAIPTAVTRLLGTRVPIVQAGMSWASSDARLPAAVSAAGGLGVIAAGPMRVRDLATTIDAVRAATDRPYAVNLPLYRKGVEEVIELLIARRPPVLIASQGGPRVHLQRFQDIGTVWLHVVASEEHAAKALEAGVDGLVVVGSEAGGHPARSGVSTLVLVRAIAQAAPGVPIVAGGGFADGYGLAAALALGAGAVQLGTRFIASVEAKVHPDYKAAILAAGIEDTRAIGPDGNLVRLLANELTARIDRLERTGAAPERVRSEWAAATLKLAALHGDVANGKVEAGQSAGLIRSVEPAATIIGRLVAEYAQVVTAMPQPSPS